MKRFAHLLVGFVAVVAVGGIAAPSVTEPNGGLTFKFIRLTAAGAQKAADAKATSEKIDLSSYEAPVVSADTHGTMWKWKVTYTSKSHTRDECFSVVIDDASGKANLTRCKKVVGGLTTRSSGP